MASKIPDEVKETVTFIFIKDASDSLRANGTAFFVGVPDEKNKERLFGYLVTAKHVLLDSQKRYFSEVFIRLNKKMGGSDLLRISLSGQEAVPIYAHNDTTVDIAVLPLLPSAETYQLKVLLEDMITTRERFAQVKIKEGDEVFFTGLFLPFFGVEKNYPIVRFGRVAMLTDELIPWYDRVLGGYQMLELYLIESQSFGGNSGSPVFFYLGATREPGVISVGPPTLLLAGIMKGSFLDAKEIQFIERSPVPISIENVGIAAVVPAYYLYEILFSKELRQIRASNQ